LEKLLANKADDISRDEGKVLDEPVGGRGPPGVGEIVGQYSKRDFNPSKAGGEILDLFWGASSNNTRRN
jgi:hypothetical protein